MSKLIVCIGGRCSTWGKNWHNHLWTIKEKLDESKTGQIKIHKSDTCFRCGMTKKEAKL
jgi:hypothetical protein